MTQEEILKAIEEMKVLELVELVSAIEERFGVSADMPVATVAAAPAGEAGDGEAEQTEFDVIITEAGSQKIQVIKAVREVTGLGLKEAKVLVDSAPKAVKEKISEKEANDIKDKLAAVGALIEVK
ncbi:MAG: 50S ribosomal protein L7/L12 [Caldisericia bacterium]|nr:50S ribosomal protein L7/L12 [Caldisericia bacterium]